MITPLSLTQAGAILAGLPIAEALATALEAAAARIADAVRDELATPPGGAHDTPWRHTGALAASIAHTADGLAAAVGSNDPAAAPQELGTATIPPRPFFAPVATALGEPVAHDVGAALAAVLAGGRA